MKKIRFLTAILTLGLFTYNYSWAGYSEKHEELISEISNSNVQKIQQIIKEIPKYKGENSKTSFPISISSTEEEILESLVQPSSYELPQVCSNCHLPNPNENYPADDWNTARNSNVALIVRNSLSNFLREQDFAKSGGRQDYYCGRLKMPLDEIYRRLADNYSLNNNAAYKDSGEIMGAKRYYNFKGEALLAKLKITPLLCATHPLLAIAAIYLGLPERQKHIRIFPTKEEGVYEIRAHDEPSAFHPLQHLHYTDSTYSDNYSEVKKIFPEMYGEPKQGVCKDEGKINKSLRRIKDKIKGFLKLR